MQSTLHCLGIGRNLNCNKTLYYVFLAELSSALCYHIFPQVLGHLNSLTLVLLSPDISCLCNIVDPNQLASEEANWSGSTLFATQYVNLYQQSGSRNLIGWQLEVGVAS